MNKASFMVPSRDNEKKQRSKKSSVYFSKMKKSDKRCFKEAMDEAYFDYRF